MEMQSWLHLMTADSEWIPEGDFWGGECLFIWGFFLHLLGRCSITWATPPAQQLHFIHWCIPCTCLCLATTGAEYIFVESKWIIDDDNPDKESRLTTRQGKKKKNYKDIKVERNLTRGWKVYTNLFSLRSLRLRCWWAHCSSCLKAKEIGPDLRRQVQCAPDRADNCSLMDQVNLGRGKQS
jgi:hypothetical protein